MSSRHALRRARYRPGRRGCRLLIRRTAAATARQSHSLKPPDLTHRWPNPPSLLEAAWRPVRELDERPFRPGMILRGRESLCFGWVSEPPYVRDRCWACLVGSSRRCSQWLGLVASTHWKVAGPSGSCIVTASSLTTVRLASVSKRRLVSRGQIG